MNMARSGGIAVVCIAVVSSACIGKLSLNGLCGSDQPAPEGYDPQCINDNGCCASFDPADQTALLNCAANNGCNGAFPGTGGDGGSGQGGAGTGGAVVPKGGSGPGGNGGTTQGGQGGSGYGGYGGGSGGQGGTGGESCDDAYEPNNTPSSHTSLADLTDEGPARELFGWISQGDYDWYHYQGLDACYTCEVSPGAKTDFPVRLCVFSACPYNQTCSVKMTPEDPNYKGIYVGCCVDGPGSVSAGTDCNGTDDSAGILISVTPLASTTCSMYSVTYWY